MTIETIELVVPGVLKGEMTKVEIPEENRIMRENEEGLVTVEWYIEGDALDPSSAIGLKPGTWEVSAHLESIGHKAGEHDLDPILVRWDDGTFTTSPHKYAYSEDIVIPANFLVAGLYKWAIALVYKLDEGTVQGKNPARMAGFMEGEIFQIFKAP